MHTYICITGDGMVHWEENNTAVCRREEIGFQFWLNRRESEGECLTQLFETALGTNTKQWSYPQKRHRKLSPTAFSTPLPLRQPKCSLWLFINIGPISSGWAISPFFLHLSLQVQGSHVGVISSWPLTLDSCIALGFCDSPFKFKAAT